MRKTFLTFLAATFALLAVSSCGKLEDSISKLDQELKDLAARVDKLEKDLNAKIEALKGTVAELDAAYKAADAALKTELEAKITATDGKFVEQLSSLKSELEEKIGKNASQEDLEALVKELSTKYEELKGEDAKLLATLTKVGVESVVKSDNGVVITFVGGSTIELPANPEEGLVTVVEVDGVKYWAVIVDGEPVVLEDAVFHPDTDLMFQVDENNQLQYSLDGGETWINTWAYVAGSEYDLVTASYYQGENYVTLFIGGVEYTLPMLSKAQANFLAGKTYFAYGQTKEVKINVKDIKSGFVASCPKGWSAELDLEALTLTVTAPAEGAGAAEGNVEVWFLSNDGIVKSSVLPVTVGDAPITITVDAKTNDVTMTFAKGPGKTWDSEAKEWVEGSFPVEVIYGATPVDEFTEEYFESLFMMPSYALHPTYGFAKTNASDENPDDAGLRAESFSGNMSELVKSLDYSKEYVIWAFVPQWTEDASINNTTSDFIKVYYKMTNVVVSDIKEGLTNVTFTVDILDPNATSFYGIYMMTEMWESYKSDFEANPSAIAQLVEGSFMGATRCLYEYDSEKGFVGSLKDFGWSEEMKGWYEEDTPDGNFNYIQPGSNGTVFIVPYVEGKTEYVMDDLTIVNLSTTKPALDPSVTYTASLVKEKTTSDYKSYTMTVKTDAPYVFYYHTSTKSDYYPATDEDVFEYLHMYEFVQTPANGELVFEETYLDVNTEYACVLVMVTEDGKAKVERNALKVSTKALYTSDPENFYVNPTIEVFDAENNIGVASFTMKGDADYLVYYIHTGGWTNYASDTYALQILNAYKNKPTETNWGLRNWIVLDLATADLTVDEEAGTKTFDVLNVALKEWETTYANAILVGVDGENITLSNIVRGSLQFEK